MLVEESTARRKRRLHQHPGSAPGSVKKKEPSSSLIPSPQVRSSIGWISFKTVAFVQVSSLPLPTSEPKGVRGGGGVKVFNHPHISKSHAGINVTIKQNCINVCCKINQNHVKGAS